MSTGRLSTLEVVKSHIERFDAVELVKELPPRTRSLPSISAGLNINPADLVGVHRDDRDPRCVELTLLIVAAKRQPQDFDAYMELVFKVKPHGTSPKIRKPVIQRAEKILTIGTLTYREKAGKIRVPATSISIQAVDLTARIAAVTGETPGQNFNESGHAYVGGEADALNTTLKVLVYPNIKSAEESRDGSVRYILL